MGGRPVTTRLVVCGNADRGDDGLAWAAIEPLLATLPRDVVATLDVRRDAELRVEDLLDLAEDASLVIVDAVSGIEPGAVVRFLLDDLVAPARSDGPRGRPMPRSSHQLPIELVLGLAGQLRQRPIPGAFIGLGGAAFGFGQGLSEVVREALPSLRLAVARELGGLGEARMLASIPPP